MDHEAKLNIETDRELDGRWIADVPALPGVIAYGSTRDEAIVHVKALALRTIADEIEHDERRADALDAIFAVAA